MKPHGKGVGKAGGGKKAAHRVCSGHQHLLSSNPIFISFSSGLSLSVSSLPSSLSLSLGRSRSEPCYLERLEIGKLFMLL